MTYEEMHQNDLIEWPYEVINPDAEGPEQQPPKFKTWAEARDAAVRWNREVSGHVARKRQ